MVRAFIAGGVLALIAPMIGSFLVVRGYSLMSDTLAHVALTGVAIGVVLGQQPLPVAIIVTLIAAVLIETLRERGKLYSESVLALFLSGSLALAVVIMSAANGLNTDLLSVLFGSITTVNPLDLYFISALGILVIISITAFYKELFLASLDQDLAKASGINVRFYNLLTVIIAAITVSLAMRIVGVLLIGALMVIPVLTAMQFGRGFKATIGIAVVFSLIAMVTGLVISYYFDLASGGTVVLVSLLFFIPSLLIKKGSS